MPHANRRNIVGQQLPTLLDVTCYVRLQTLLHVVAQNLKPVKLFSHQLPSATVLDPFPQLFQRSSNIVGATHAHCAWFTKNGGGSFSRCIACPNIVGSCYIRLHTTANTHATMFRVVVSVCTQPDTSEDLIE